MTTMMIKLNKSKIAALVEKCGKTIAMVANDACLAYTTAKHIIQEGKDCVDTTSVDKAERLAKALGTSVKAITIGKAYDRYPKKASAKAAKAPAPKKAAKKATAEKAPAKQLEIPEAKLADHIRTDSRVMDELANLTDRVIKLTDRVNNLADDMRKLVDDYIKLNERITNLEKIVLKNSNRKKIVKVQ